MNKYIALFLFFAGVSFVSSCKAGSCACPMTHQDTDILLENIQEKEISTTIYVEKFATQHIVL